ncbi:MAG: hypothetical protein JETT_3594 [Candidatus Jettenia ecosi]|uniref:Uncharacterized protein n=1 Tax=Candidatus Jettenia ecosi TaxID=2494326 RepID=A0A533Q7N2_9BACT|nr:MAG: hypothetical protein JETT_3594 [Candidatus Jettenia ecosi]
MIIMKNLKTTGSEICTYTHALNIEFQEFEIWIKNMNYKLFLEYTHSSEYYKRKQMPLG